ncbi:Predicted arabinose efflux permease, MFS family [Kytococcus aerolatus]|uniref:Predicted arabinose efflux permease, MFS family n=1 Tax=Kytococcus aerolatus TaxID=592308 RepID=A0A212U667_9MICO|nr:MFS transporter [Kytococcus aerolatus]SNC73581.1 Predicted arabinose efflux permease, MFS family [Kytococcus aerolatus]
MPTTVQDPARGTSRGALFTRSFVLMLVSVVGAFVNFAVLMPLVPAWAERSGLSQVAVGGTTSVMMGACVVSQLVMPWLLDRFGFVRPFVAGLVLMGAPVLALPWAQEVASIYSVQAVRGVGFGLLVVSGSALAATLAPRHLRGRAVGTYGVSIALAQIPSLPAGVPLAGAIGWPAVFWIAGLAALVVLPAAVLVRERQEEPVRLGATGLEEEAAAGRDRPWVTPAVLLLSSSLAFGAVGTFLSLGLDSARVVLLALLGVSGGQVVGRAWAGTVSDRRGVGQLLAPMSAAAAIGMACMALAMADPGQAPLGLPALLVEDGMAVLGAALLGMGFGALQNDTLVLMIDRIGPGRVGLASTVWNVGYDAGTGSGSLVVGGLAGAIGIAGGFGVLATLGLVAVPAAMVMARAEARVRAERVAHGVPGA